MLDRLKDKLGMRRTPEDVGADPNIARTRETGGAPPEETTQTAVSDGPSTTGTAGSGEFVGQVAGQDSGGGDEETGAEARARAEDEPGKPHSA